MTKNQDIRYALGQRLADAHANAPTPNRRTLDERQAAGFRPDPRTERLLELRRTDRAAFDRLPPSVRMGVGYYEGGKAALDRLKEADDA